MNLNKIRVILVSVFLLATGSAVSAVCGKKATDGSQWVCTANGPHTCLYEWSTTTPDLGHFLGSATHKTATWQCTEDGHARGFVIYNNDLNTFEEWGALCDEIQA